MAAKFDGDEFGRTIVEAVNASIDRSIAPLIKRLDALEATTAGQADTILRLAEVDTVRGMIDDVRAGLESTIGPEMQVALSAMVDEAIKAIPAPADGKSVTIDDVRPLIVEAVGEAVKAIPAPPDVDVEAIVDQVRSGITLPELPDIAAMVGEAVGEAVKAIPVPVAPELPDIAAMVGEAVKAIPVPVAPELPDIAAMVGEAVGEAVKAIPVPVNGKDGADVVDAIIGKDDHLHLTLSNGKVKDVGRVVGWDGVDCDFERVDKRIADDIKALFDAAPKPRDGFGFDDLSVEHDGERTITIVFQRGGERKEFPVVMPVVLDRGVFVEGKTYDRGDSVTWAGSTWIAQKDKVTSKPETSNDWRLAVKRGSKGKDGVMTLPRENKPVELGKV
jgi:hypothetical protein